MPRSPTHRIALLSAAIIFAVVAIPRAALAQESGEKKTAAKQAKKHIYDEKADAEADIAAAVARAKKENKRVLVMYGGNWCGWCYKLHDVFKKNRDVARTLLYEYELVMVDIGRTNKHQDIVKAYEAKIKGVPFLTVLDGDGKVVVNQPTEPLEEGGDHHNPDLVQAFLTKHKTEPLSAKTVFNKALASAESQGKMVFMHLGAPWCGWCHKLEAFLDQKEIAAIMNRDFVDLKIDIDRMTGGKDIQAKYQPTSSGGIPWFAILDSKGEVLATSDGENGNVGFPVKKYEIAHFIDVLTKTRKNISADDTGKIEAALIESAKKIKGG